MNAPFDFANGNEDYLEAYRSEASLAEHMTDRWEQTHEAAKTLLLAAEQEHAALVARIEALADEFDSAGSHYHRDRVLAVLKEMP